jgi:hypothetical protein
LVLAVHRECLLQQLRGEVGVVRVQFRLAQVRQGPAELALVADLAADGDALVQRGARRV